MERDDGARGCDFWMWDGSLEYEGAVAKLADGCFTAHLRETRRGSGPGRRISTTFFDVQRQFSGRRFLAFCRLSPDGGLQEAEVTSVQRSSAADFEYFVCGRVYVLDESGRDEALRRLPSGLSGRIDA